MQALSIYPEEVHYVSKDIDYLPTYGDLLFIRALFEPFQCSIGGGCRSPLSEGTLNFFAEAKHLVQDPIQNHIKNSK